MDLPFRNPKLRWAEIESKLSVGSVYMAIWVHGARIKLQILLCSLNNLRLYFCQKGKYIFNRQETKISLFQCIFNIKIYFLFHSSIEFYIFGISIKLKHLKTEKKKSFKLLEQTIRNLNFLLQSLSNWYNQIALICQKGKKKFV